MMLVLLFFLKYSCIATATTTIVIDGVVIIDVTSITIGDIIETIFIYTIILCISCGRSLI